MILEYVYIVFVFKKQKETRALQFLFAKLEDELLGAISQFAILHSTGSLFARKSYERKF